MSVIEICEKQDIDALLISFDFLKAFDMVEWNVLFAVMKKFGFQDPYINMVKNLFKGIESCTINQGFSSDYIKITISLRQGDPISSSLFILVVDVLAQRIRQNKKIKGINLKGKEKKLGQFVDDLWTSILAEQSNYTCLLSMVQNFRDAVGMSINYDKTQVMRIGSLRYSNAKFYSEHQLHWTDTAKILGIIVQANRDLMRDVNYESLLGKIQKTLEKLSRRTLTLKERILVVNTMVTSLATQKFTVLPSPKPEFFQKAITTFIWKGKKPRIAYNRLMQSIQDGGLQLTDLESKEKALKIIWIKKYIQE